jgi:UDP-GlcNAc:undecaprenyl-phosphate GlcNAc-1-phosphate transferase
MNSINLLDNMDGVTGAVSVLIMASAAVVMLLYPMAPEVNPFYFTVMASIGAVVGFLLLNWNPSKIYMGDTGSQFLGALLAYIGVKFFWNIQNMNHSVVTSMQVITPVMVFLVPIMDTSFVFVSRIMRGQSPFVGGKDHLTHHLYYIGVQERWVPLVLSLVSGLSGLLAIFTVRYVFQWNHIYTAIFSAYILVSMTAFFLLYKRGQRVGRVKEYLKTKAASRNTAPFPAKGKVKSPSPQKQVN